MTGSRRSWRWLFDRAAGYEVTRADVEAALAAHREGDGERD